MQDFVNIQKKISNGREKQFKDFYENIPIAYFSVSLEGKILRFNQRALKMLGYKKGELLGKQVFELYTNSPDGKSKAKKLFNRFLKGEIIQNEELQMKKADDTSIWINLSVSPIKDSSGKIIESCSFVTDITEHKKIQEKLAESEHQYRQLFNRMIEGFFLGKIIVGKNGKPIDFIFLKVNDSFEKQSGLKKEDVVGKPVSIAVPEIEQNWIEIYGKVALLGHSVRFENYNKYTNRWYEVHSYSPTKEQFAVMFTDISNRKKAEKILQESEKKQRLLLNCAPIAICELDIERMKFKNVNNTMCKMLGYSKKEMHSMNPYELLAGNQKEAFKEEIKSLLTEKKINNNFDSKILTKYGHELWFNIRFEPIYEKGKLDSILIIGYDFTEEKKLLNELVEIKNDLNHAQHVGNIGSWRLNVDRNVLIWSDETYRIFGIPKGTPLTYETFLSCIHPDDRDYVNQKWKAALKGEQYAIEHRIVVNGKIRWVYEKAELEFDNNSNIKGGFGTAQEITKFVKMREKLRFYREHLEDLLEEKTEQLRKVERLVTIGETAGMIGHDIRNPLQSMDGALYLANEFVESLPEDCPERDELKEIHELIRKQVSYIDHMVADLQDFAGSSEPKLEDIDLPEIINESLRLVQIPENIKVNVVLQKSFNLFADADHLKRIFSNLFINAIQAMPDGGELNISAHYKGGFVWIEIEDTGVGMSEDVKTKVFIPLFTTKSKGQGFGLAVCKKLVEAQKGQISFRSEEGKGTTFTIKFPINKDKII